MRNAISRKHCDPAVRSQGIGRSATGLLRVFACLTLGLLLSACSSTGSAPFTTGPRDAWTPVQEIDRGADLRVTVDCAQNADHDACATPPVGDDPSIRVVVGKHVQADGQFLVFRAAWDDSELLRVGRPMVHSVDVLKRNSGRLGALLGTGAGLGLCIASGVFGESLDLGLLGVMIFAPLCAGGGGGLGYAIQRQRSSGKFTPVRVYQRDAQPPGSAP